MFRRRLRILTAAFLIAIAILAARLAWLQIFDHQRYVSMARDAFGRRRGQWIATVRGSIYDCRGRTLACDLPSFNLCFHYRFTRLFDQRFWQYQHAEHFETDGPISADAARRYLKKEFDLSAREIDTFIDRLPDPCAVAFSDVQTALRIKADHLLAGVARTIDQPVSQLHSALTRINDLLYRWKLSAARRRYCRKKQIACPPAGGVEAIEQSFAQIAPDPKVRLRWIGQTRLKEAQRPQVALTDISEEMALLVEERFVGSLFGDRGDRPVSIQTAGKRHYPYRDLACHLIGQIGPCPASSEPPAEIAGVAPTAQQLSAYQPADRTGAWGIEKVFEPLLRGRRGWIRPSDDPKLDVQIDAITGQNVSVTWDIQLHSKIQSIFAAHGYFGAAVLIDVPTAQVRAMVSVPTFDLNTYYQHDQFALINEIGGRPDPQKRWRNRALETPYEPGSTIKPTILAGGLQARLITPDREVDCHVANKDWSGAPRDIKNHGWCAARDALRVSCNFYFIMLGRQLGAEATVAWLEKCGFGRPILAWPDQANVSNVRRAFREASGHLTPLGKHLPSALDLRVMSIGRGVLDASVLQMANSVATIARDGVFMPPILVSSPAAEPTAQRIMSTDTAKVVQEGMQAVVYQRGGTAHRAFSRTAGLLPWEQSQLTLGGKTGSTDYALFACYARSDTQCLALAVLVEELDAHGGAVAAPVARDILIACAEAGYLPDAPHRGQLNYDRGHRGLLNPPIRQLPYTPNALRSRLSLQASLKGVR